jgi:hypothetical protein
MSSLEGLSDSESASGLPLKLKMKLKMNLYGYGLRGTKGRREQVEFDALHSGFHLYKFIFLVKECWYFIHTDH